MPPGRNCQTFDNNLLTATVRPPGDAELNSQIPS